MDIFCSNIWNFALACESIKRWQDRAWFGVMDYESNEVVTWGPREDVVPCRRAMFRCDAEAASRVGINLTVQVEPGHDSSRHGGDPRFVGVTPPRVHLSQSAF